MRLSTCLLLAASTCSVPVAAHDDELPINTGSELVDWCKAESEAQFVAQEKTAYNWVARHVERGNALVVEGNWRVDGERIEVECRIAKGARREYATMSITPA
jgi:hypothetical protein